MTSINKQVSKIRRRKRVTISETVKGWRVWKLYVVEVVWFAAWWKGSNLVQGTKTRQGVSKWLCIISRNTKESRKGNNHQNNKHMERFGEGSPGRTGRPVLLIQAKKWAHKHRHEVKYSWKTKKTRKEE